LGIPACGRVAHVEEGVVDLVGRRGLAQRQGLVGLQRIRTARFGSVAVQRDPAAGPDHDALPDLRRLLRREQLGRRLGYQ
ncbi:hypothetical protein C6A85_07750, partial [Mycobacterium sp. ITM-2017-0098]